MESAEFEANDEEDAERFGGVFDVGEEGGVKAEGERDFGGLVEVGFKDMSGETE